MTVCLTVWNIHILNDYESFPFNVVFVFPLSSTILFTRRKLVRMMHFWNNLDQFNPPTFNWSVYTKSRKVSYHECVLEVLTLSLFLGVFLLDIGNVPTVCYFFCFLFQYHSKIYKYCHNPYSLLYTSIYERITAQIDQYGTFNVSI
jgi:hypothetical protein